MPTGSHVINIPWCTFWAAGQSQGVSNIKHSFPPSGSSALSLAFQGNKETGVWVALWTDKASSAACSIFCPGKRHRLQVLGEAICSSRGDETGLRTMLSWPLCFQLERPLRKPISQHLLQIASIHPIWCFPWMRAGPETSLKLRKELPDFPKRGGWLVCSRWIRNACFMPAVNGQGTWNLGPEQGHNVSSLGGETDGLSHFYQERRSWNAQGLLLKYANHTNSPPEITKTNHSNF